MSEPILISHEPAGWRTSLAVRKIWQIGRPRLLEWVQLQWVRSVKFGDDSSNCKRLYCCEDIEHVLNTLSHNGKPRRRTR